MLSSIKFKSLSVAVSTLVLSTSANAAFIYTYTGNQYDTFTSTSSYDNSMSVTGTLELEYALGNNLNEQSVAPLRFSFSNGRDTYTDPVNASFQFSTDQTGAITGWRATAATGGLLQQGDILTTFTTIKNFTGPSDVDSGGFYTCTAADSNGCTASSSEYGLINNASGSWTVQEVSAVPVPAAVWLFGSGLLGLVGLARRKNA